MVRLRIVALLAVAACVTLAAEDYVFDVDGVTAGSKALISKRSEVFVNAVQLFSASATTTSYNVSLAALLDAARGHPELVGPYFKRYARFYMGDDPKAGPERTDGVSAGVVMWVAGKCGFAAEIAPLLTDKSPSCVIYAYAESRGLKLYHNITEDAGIDQIVNPEQARGILNANGLLPTAKP
jgi:hypothetical protein